MPDHKSEDDVYMCADVLLLYLLFLAVVENVWKQNYNQERRPCILVLSSCSLDRIVFCSFRFFFFFWSHWKNNHSCGEI